jgi:hypothetical protein
MSAESDPFGFDQPAPGFSPRPMTVVALPGQEVRIVVADGSGAIPGFFLDGASPKGSGDSGASPKGSGDSGASPKGSGDSGASPKGSGDSGASPKGSGDARIQDPFGFVGLPQPGFSPRPITIIAQAGQELRVVVPDLRGGVPGIHADTASPKGSGDGTG